jgi:hypothetical protein
VFSSLTRHGLRPAAGAPPLPLLEVGAVNTQLLSVPWLAVRAIDLRSSHPRIEERDFFDLAPAAAFGAVVSSMVLNCVPDAASRGAMLRGMRAHLREGGMLFVMLPLRCVTHSRFTTRASFADALAAAGFEARGAGTHACSWQQHVMRQTDICTRAGAGHKGVAEGCVCVRARGGAATRRRAARRARALPGPAARAGARRGADQRLRGRLRDGLSIGLASGAACSHVGSATRLARTRRHGLAVWCNRTSTNESAPACDAVAAFAMPAQPRAV